MKNENIFYEKEEWKTVYIYIFLILVHYNLHLLGINNPHALFVDEDIKVDGFSCPSKSNNL